MMITFEQNPLDQAFIDDAKELQKCINAVSEALDRAHAKDFFNAVNKTE